MPRTIAVGRRIAGNPLAPVPWVAQWKFNGDGNDFIGANHLTNNNSATFVEGKLGGATGATQLVAASSQSWSIADNAALSCGASSDIGVAAWVYFDTVATCEIVFKGRNNNGATIEYRLFYSSGFKFGAGNQTTWAVTDSGGTATTATWYCVMGWLDNANQLAWVQVDNNAPVSIAYALGTGNGTKPLAIGGDTESANNYLNGRVDAVGVAISATGGGAAFSTAVRSVLYNGGAGTENFSAFMEYQRQQRNVWREIGRLWEQQKRGWFNQGRGKRVFA